MRNMVRNCRLCTKILRNTIWTKRSELSARDRRDLQRAEILGLVRYTNELCPGCGKEVPDG